MIHILLVIIYLAFISLGLPDSLLGSAWPVMHMEFSVPISYAGAVSMMIAAGTIISSLLSDRLTRKLGTGRVTAISVGMTAAAGRTVFHWHHHRTCYQRLCHLQIQRLADGPHRTHAILSARAAGTDDCHTRAALQEVNTMFADYHVHTSYSDDSEYPMEEVVRDAVSLGLEEICFTDHVDYGVKRDWDDPRGILYRRGRSGEPEHMALANVDYPRYASEIAALKDKYKDQITIKMGLEFGMQVYTIPQYEKLFSAWPFDFVILSVHQIENKEFWTQDFQSGHTQAEYNLRYYEEILALVQQYHNYSILGHLDLISRYDKASSFPFEKIRSIIEKILITVITDGKGIEVNTSSHRYGLSDLTPSIDILRLYRDLGGKIITVGSDSHRKEHLGAYIAETLNILKTIGYKEVYTFEQMQPIPHKI